MIFKYLAPAINQSSYRTIFLFLTDNGTTIHEKLKELTGQRTVPNIFIRGKHIGGADDTIKLHEEGKLMDLIVPPSENYTYDLIVVGGGSGGLACSKVVYASIYYKLLVKKVEVPHQPRRPTRLELNSVSVA